MGINITIIAKNQTINNIIINDMDGLIIPGNEQINLTDDFQLDYIYESEDLITSINSGDIIINDGTNDLSIPDALIFLQSFNSTNIISGSLPGCQIRRTTSYVLTTSWTDITMDTTDVENNVEILEHDNTNTNRINIKEEGLYLVSYTCELDGGLFELRCLLDNTTIIPGSERYEDNYAGELHEISSNFLVEIGSGNHYISLQAIQTVTTTMNPNVNLTIVKLQGYKGEQGIPGSGSNITIKDEGINIPNTPHTDLNFIGDLITVADGGSGIANITIHGHKPNLFQSIKTTTQTSTGTYTDLVTWTTPDFENSDYTFNTTTGVLTFNTYGIYEISVHVFGSGSTNRTQLDIKVQEDVGSGYIDIIGCNDSQYTARNSTQNSGSAQINNYIRSFTATDSIKIQIKDIGSPANCVGKFTVKRLK